MPLSYVVHALAASKPALVCDPIVPGHCSLKRYSSACVGWERSGTSDDVQVRAASKPKKDPASFSIMQSTLPVSIQYSQYLGFNEDLPSIKWIGADYRGRHAGQPSKGERFWLLKRLNAVSSL